MPAHSKQNICFTPVSLIALAQLFGTSLWFSANGAADDLMRAWGLTPADIGSLTNAVQVGFIFGTLVFAITSLADRFRASRIFMASSIAGGVFNAGFVFWADGLASAMVFRFLVGVCLAGIYPLGMKLIVSWAPERAGLALAYLVAMVTLGTALPHGVRYIGAQWPWENVILISSGFALIGATFIGALGDGPHLKSTRGARLRLGHVLSAFKSPEFRAAAIGYFGHMWELYAFWALLPLLIASAAQDGLFYREAGSGFAFAIIASGALGCVLGGLFSRGLGSARVAAIALLLSFSCCVVFTFFAHALSPAIMLALLLVWGMSVVADSPQFSALAARSCPPGFVGSALAAQTSIGFAISVVALQITAEWFDAWGLGVTWLLLPGPLIGLWGLWPLWAKPQRP